LHDFTGTELIAAVHKINGAGKLAQVGPFFHSGVSATHDNLGPLEVPMR
jgi:hypothetical protein